VSKVAGGQREIGGSAANDAVLLSIWAFDTIERDRTYDEK
jgi:hypothetical protein